MGKIDQNRRREKATSVVTTRPGLPSWPRGDQGDFMGQIVLEKVTDSERPFDVTTALASHMRFRRDLIKEETQKKSGKNLKHPFSAYCPGGEGGRGYHQKGINRKDTE